MQTETNVEISSVKSAALNLLIVDDEVATRNLCNDVALEAGLHVHTSATTEQALDILDQYPDRHRGHGFEDPPNRRTGTDQARFARIIRRSRSSC